MKKFYTFFSVLLIACLGAKNLQAQTASLMFGGEIISSPQGDEVVFAELSYTGGTPNLYFGFNKTGTVVDAWNSYSVGFNMNQADLQIRPRNGGSNINTVKTTVGEKFQVWFAFDSNNNKYSFKVKTNEGEFKSFGDAPAYEYGYRNTGLKPITHYVAAGSAGTLHLHEINVVTDVNSLPIAYAGNAGIENILISAGALTFNETTYSYNVELPKGTTSVDVSVVTTVGLAKVSGDGSIDVSSGAGSTVVKVTSPDGNNFSSEYTLNFTVKGESEDATLADLQVDGTTITGFSASKTEYFISLPGGSAIPTVTATKNDPDAEEPVVTATVQIPGVTTVKVKAENGSEVVYSVNFTYDYLYGWNDNLGTPKGAGWDGPTDNTIDWTNQVYWRTGVGSPVNNGSSPMLYTIFKETTLNYEIGVLPAGVYKLTGKGWRRNGGGSAKSNFNFTLATDIEGNNAVHSYSKVVNGNNVIADFETMLIVSSTDTNPLFLLWEVGEVEGNWENAGIWDMHLVSISETVLEVSTNGLTFNNGLKERTFTVYGGNLTSDVEVSAPAGVTLSGTGLVSGSSVTLLQRDGVLDPTEITVTWDESADFEGIIVVSTAGKDDHIIDVATYTPQISNWAGRGATGDYSTPEDVGWINSANWWGVANSGAGVRFRDNLAPVADGRYMLIRGDYGALGTAFYLPIELDYAIYEFSMDFFNGNSSGSADKLTVSICEAADVSTQIATKAFVAAAQNEIVNDKLEFTAPVAGIYYLAIECPDAWYGITNLELESILTSLDHDKSNLNIRIASVQNGLMVYVAQPERVQITSMTGQVIVNRILNAGDNFIALPQGVYIVNGNKTVVN